MVYIIQKQFIFKEKTFYKDKTLTSADLSAADIERLIDRGFIKSTDMSSVFSDDADDAAPEIGRAETYLLPGEVNKLNKDDLVEYATRIGVGEFDPAITKPELQKIVNGFIAAASEADEDEDDEEVDEGDA